MIGILDYGAGNIKSVMNALDRLDVEYFLSDDPKKLATANKIIFPGVGNAKFAIKSLKKKNLDVFLKNCTKPVLGICLGMQMLFDFSEEENTECLGIIPGRVIRFDPEKCEKIPHMGWNSVISNQLSVNSESEFFVYFVHSYYAPVSDYTMATCNYGGLFSAAVQKDNFTGMQFHPEKSGKVGEEILRKFCK